MDTENYACLGCVWLVRPRTRSNSWCTWSSLMPTTRFSRNRAHFCCEKNVPNLMHSSKCVWVTMVTLYGTTSPTQKRMHVNICDQNRCFCQVSVGELELSSLSITPLRPTQHTSANGSLLVEMYESRKTQVGKGERTRKEHQEHKITSTLARKRHV